MTLPNFIGIGAPKAGTTWLSKCLGEHPDVFIPSCKELVVFDYRDYGEPQLSKYRSYFEGVKDESAIGEFTTRYLSSERAAGRIRELIPDARFIVCLRNPADQMYSHYWHLARQNFHQVDVQKEHSFEEALERFPDLLKKPARYWDHLQFWHKFYDRDQFLILLYDDIVKQPALVLRQTFQFLGVDPQFQPQTKDERGSAVRQGRSPRSPLAQSVHARVYNTLAYRVYKPLKQIMGMRQADRLKEALRIRPLMEFMFFRRGYPPMKKSTRKMLNAEFADQVRGVEQLLGRSLENWKS